MRQVQAAFETLLDILLLQSQIKKGSLQAGLTSSSETLQPSDVTELLKAISLQLLGVGMSLSLNA